MKFLQEYKGYKIYRDSSAENPDFFCKMGRFFADKTIRKELEGPLDDGDNYIWLIVMKDGDVIAFSSCRIEGKIAWFNETYVSPEYREQGLFSLLFNLKYEICAGKGVDVVKGLANGRSSPAFEAHGWEIVSRRGKWTHYQKVVEHG